MIAVDALPCQNDALSRQHGAASWVSGVLLCQVMFQMNGFSLHGSSPVPVSHSLSQTGGVAFIVYVRLSKREMLGGGTLMWFHLVTLIYP